MIDVLVYGKDGCPQVIDAEHISDYTDGGHLVWVDTIDPSSDDLRSVQEEFGLHPLALEDARKHGQRPKLEQYTDHSFLVAYSGNLAEVDVFFGDGWVVTVRGRGENGEPWDPTPALGRFEKSGPEHATCGFLLYIILDEIVDEYFDHAEAVEEHVEQLEDMIFAEEVADERDVQERLYDLRRSLLHFRRKVVPLREVVGAILRREVPFIDERALTHFQDVYDHVLRAIDQVDSQRELMGNAVDAHLAIISNRMNEVMKKMTSWGAILLGSTLVAGIYGMNFEHMPELGWRLGYAFALAVMATVTVVGYWYFRRKDWL